MCSSCVTSHADSIFSCAEVVDTDVNWKLTRSPSMILQNFQDEIAQSKHKAAKTLVHKLEWQPYGDRIAEDAARTTYTAKLTRFVKQLLEGSESTDKQLLKVCPPEASCTLPHLRFRLFCAELAPRFSVLNVHCAGTKQ